MNKVYKILHNKISTLSICVIVVLSLSCFDLADAYQTESELKSDLNSVAQQQQEVSEDLEEVAAKISALQKDYDEVSTSVSNATREIASMEKEIESKKYEMQEREVNLNERLVVMYKNGTVSFVDVLLGSSSISEFISNVEMIQRIYKNDIEVMKTLEEEHASLEEEKAKLEEKKTELRAKQSELTLRKTELDEQKKILNDKEDELKAEADQLKGEILSLQNTQKVYVGGVMTWPCPSSSYITSPFGNRLHPITKVYKFHTGIDIGANSGSNVIAAQSGDVIMSAWYYGYGNCIMVDHGGGIVTLYGHLSGYACQKGDSVSAGEVIGYVGSTGNSTGPHLHFEVRVNGEYVDPMGYVQ